MDVQVGQTIIIGSNAPFFSGKIAYIAYVGTEGVSVYLDDD